MDGSNAKTALILMLFFIFLSGCAQSDDFSVYGFGMEDAQGLKTFGSKDLVSSLRSVNGTWGECVGISYREKYFGMNYPPQLNILNCRFKDEATAKHSFDQISTEDFNQNGSCKKISSNFGEDSLQLSCIVNHTEVNENLLIVLDGNQRYTLNIVNAGSTAEEDVKKAYEIFESKGKGARMFEIKSLREPVETLYEIFDVVIE